MQNRASLLLTLLFSVSACGVPPGVEDASDIDESSGETETGLSTVKDSFVIVRRDTRKCVSPLCGGHFVSDVNLSGAERYVNALDFSNTTLSEHDIDVVVGAPDNTVILFGHLGIREKLFKTRSFVVTEAYRGLPGLVQTDADTFYSTNLTKIACIKAPCNNLQASRLNRTTGSKMVSEVDVSRAQLSLVDPAWLNNRVVNGGALVAGQVRSSINKRWLDATQIFLRLPEQVMGCPKVSVMKCPEGYTNAWTRNENRCLMPSGCVEQVFCATVVPACDEGYTSISWSHGCTQYACDPEFLY